MAYMHANGIVHRDIKPENFLLTTKHKRAELRMIDFGLSKKLDNANSSMKKTIGSPYYIPPEVLKGSYTLKCDVWSMAIILYVMIVG